MDAEETRKSRLLDAWREVLEEVTAKVGGGVKNPEAVASKRAKISFCIFWPRLQAREAKFSEIFRVFVQMCHSSVTACVPAGVAASVTAASPLSFFHPALLPLLPHLPIAIPNEVLEPFETFPRPQASDRGHPVADRCHGRPDYIFEHNAFQGRSLLVPVRWARVLVKEVDHEEKRTVPSGRAKCNVNVRAAAGVG